MIHATLRPIAHAIVLLLWASSASALTLEKSFGPVILGRSLDFKVQATVSSNEDTASLCLEADVIQGDTLMNASQVNVQLLKPGSNGSSVLRVSSPFVVEEPVLTVVVRYGCLSKSSRRYVVFADPPMGANETTQTPSVMPALTAVPSPKVAAPSGYVAQPENGRSNSIARQRQTAARPANNALKQSRRLASPAQIESAKSESAKPRLQLESIESTFDASVRLKSTMELVTVPAESASTQRSEAAALWRVLSAPSEELQKDIQRLAALQAETRALQQASNASRSEISRLSTQLNEAQNKQYANPVVYGLLAALALLLTFAAYVFRAFKDKSPKAAWWTLGREIKDSDNLRGAGKPQEMLYSKRVLPQRQNLTAGSVPSQFHEGDGSVAQAPTSVQKSKFSESAFAQLAVQGNPRGVNVEELFDIQQQADFFISLGQHDQAIEVLANHIEDNAQTSPLVYLDLLKLYHRQGRRAEYENLIVEFTRLFNAAVPPFDEFQEKTRGLEAYASTLVPITAAWHSPAVLAVIEDSVFRGIGRSNESLDLEAYRELLLLHSIAKDLAEHSVFEYEIGDQNQSPNQDLTLGIDPASVHTSGQFNQTVPQKLTSNILEPVIGSTSTDIRSGHSHKPVGDRIGLDIDLSSDIATPTLEDYSPRSASPKQEVALDGSSGFIEFDLDAFSTSSQSKPKSKTS